MALQEKLVPVVFNAGVDTGKDPKQVDQGLHQLENGIWDKEGSISKRVGLAAFSGTKSHERITRLADKAVVYGSPGVSIHNGATATAGNFTDVNGGTLDGRLYHMDCVAERSYGDGSLIVNAETLETSTLKVVSFCRRNGTNYELWLNVYSLATGGLVDSLELTPASTTLLSDTRRSVRLVEEDGDIYAFYIRQATEGSPDTWQLYSVNVSSGGVIQTPQIVETGLAAADQPGYYGYQADGDLAMDAAVVGTATIVAYANTVGDVRVVATSDGTVMGTRFATFSNSGGGSAACMKVAAFEHNGDVVVAVADDDLSSGDYLVRATVYQVDPSATPTVAATDIMGWGNATIDNGADAIAGVSIDSTRFSIYATRRSSDDSTETWLPTDIIHNKCQVSGASLVLANASTTFDRITNFQPEQVFRGVALVSRPVKDSNDEIYMVVARPEKHAERDTVEPTTLVIARHVHDSTDEELRIAGKCLAGTAHHNYQTSGFLSDMVTTSTGFMTSGLYIPPAGSDIVDGVDATTVCTLRIVTDHSLMDAVEEQGAITMANSCPWSVTNGTIVESGFLSVPRLLITTEDGAQAPILPQGSYGFIAEYSWSDESGRQYASAPSLVTQFIPGSTAGTGLGTIKVSCLHLTSKLPVNGAGQVYINLYRTSALGTTYYLVESKPNDPDEPMVTFTADHDNSSGMQILDADLAYKRTILASGQDSSLVNDQPHPYRIHTVHQDRHVYVHRDYEDTYLFYSHQFKPGIATEYSNALSITVPPEGGAVVALISFMDKLFIFKERSVYAVHGHGLGGNGLGTGYSQPYLVTDSVGLSVARSLVRTPLGLMFMAERGILIIDGSMKVSPVGRRVEYHTGQITISSAQVIPRENLVVFTASSASGDLSLVYDYVNDQWSTFTNYDCLDSVEAKGVLYQKKASAVWVEDTSTYLDPTSAQVPLKLTTGWFSFAGLSGYKRVKEAVVLAQYLTAHQLRVKTSYDYDPVWVDDQTFDPELSTTLNSKYVDYASHFGSAKDSTHSDKSYLVEVSGSRQKCASVRYEITDQDPVAGGTSGQAIRLNGLALQIGFKTGAKRLGNARSI